MVLDRRDISLAVRIVLNREPQDAGELDVLSAVQDLPTLRRRLLDSPEFKNLEKIPDATGKWVMAEIHGGRRYIWLNLADKFVSFGCLIDNYEPVETRVFRQLCQPGMHVIDVGANIGWYSITAADIVGPSGSVLAVEPSPHIFPYLDRSMRFNDFGGEVQTANCALADRSGEMFLSWAPASGNPGGAFLSSEASDAAARVEVVRLDDYLGSKGCDLIKLDIEGAEPLMLRGAEKTLRRSRPTILCEINPGALARVSQMGLDEFYEQIRAYNYSAYGLDDTEKTLGNFNNCLTNASEVTSVILRPNM